MRENVCTVGYIVRVFALKDREKKTCMKYLLCNCLFVFALLLCSVNVRAQESLTFRVSDFGVDDMDLTARSDAYKRVDGSGSLYAIIKVSSDRPEDLPEYNFNFGNMNSFVEQRDGELWVYVQKNAKMVTVTRSGYVPLRQYDLRTTIEAGKTYRMMLTAKAAVVYTQMVLFKVSPAGSGAVVTIKGSAPDATEQMLGAVDASGAVAKNLPFDTYTYRIFSENYYPTEGRFTLNDKTQTHVEEMTLKPRFSMVTLSVDADADIYVNGERKGRRTWTGALNAGIYQVECRMESHRSSHHSITVQENTPGTHALPVPEPIVGMLSVLSSPLGATIKVDGRDYGTTPRNIPDVLIGRHMVTLSREGYGDEQATVDIREGQTSDVNVTLKERAKSVNGIEVGKEDKTFTVNGVQFVMKPVQGGTFRMGATAEQGSEAESDEKPVHDVTLSSYYMGQTEVTQALWQAVMGKNPSNFKSDSRQPVEQVSWKDCQQFVEKLNKMLAGELGGRKFRLPTEAEWEYAARGGQKSKGYKYSGSNDLNSVAWYTSNSGSKTHPVATKQSNELGLYDMTGNVWEWCEDWYGSYTSSAQTNPTGASSGSIRVYRGGSWFNSAEFCRVSFRNRFTPACRGSRLGLRLAL